MSSLTEQVHHPMTLDPHHPQMALLQTALFVQPMSVKNVGQPSILTHQHNSETAAATALAQLAAGNSSDDASSTTSSSSQSKRLSPSKRKESSLEMDDTQYRLKRQRNNEAVRRCRLKKKKMIEKKDQQLTQLENQVSVLRTENSRLNEIISRQARELQELKAARKSKSGTRNGSELPSPKSCLSQF